MNGYIISEDHKKVFCYALGNLILSIFFLILSVFFFGIRAYLFTFFGVTIVWFTIKFMSRYTGMLWNRKPVLEFTRDELRLNTLSTKGKTMRYDDIRLVKMKRSKTTIKLFISGEHVEHPSKVYYVRIVYPFQKDQLEEVIVHLRAYFRKHNILMEEIIK